LRCLIVDDEESCREFIATLLRSAAECHQASSGAKTLEKYKNALDSNNPYDLIILDIMMPGMMSGHDAIRGIRSIEKRGNLGKKVYIIILSMLNPSCDAQADAYLRKPVSKEALFNVITKMGLLQ